MPVNDVDLGVSEGIDERTECPHGLEVTAAVHKNLHTRRGTGYSCDFGQSRLAITDSLRLCRYNR